MARIHHPDQAARIVDRALEGEAVARAALTRIADGTSDPDLIFRTVLRAFALDGFNAPAGPSLRAACRAIQKHVEATAPA